MRQQSFLGFRFTVGSHGDLSAFIARQIGGAGTSRVVVHGNVHTLHLATRGRDLGAVIAAPEVALIFEGIGLKLGRYFTSGEWWPDVNGTDLVPMILSLPREYPLKLALVGGKPGVAAAAAQTLTRGTDKVWVVATFDGYSDCEDENTLVSKLVRAKPDLVLVGLGTPLQECRAISWASALPGTLFWAVGGLFDYYSGNVKRAPLWMRRVRIEWMWRILQEPSRLWKRYVSEAAWLLYKLVRH